MHALHKHAHAHALAHQLDTSFTNFSAIKFFATFSYNFRAIVIIFIIIHYSVDSFRWLELISRILWQKRIYTYIHTYIHNCLLQPFNQDYGLAFHSTHVVCVNFIREWRNLQFNVDSERQIFEKLFHGRFIYLQSFCQKSAERKSPKKYFFIFHFWWLIWDTNPGFCV